VQCEIWNHSRIGRASAYILKKKMMKKKKKKKEKEIGNGAGHCR
jgi:hypothetical protein